MLTKGCKVGVGGVLCVSTELLVCCLQTGYGQQAGSYSQQAAGQNAGQKRDNATVVSVTRKGTQGSLSCCA
jgi:hypothetical protein